MKKQWFVYKYTFPNGKVYIGKAGTKSNRFGVTSGYKGQLVYRAMKKYPEYQKEILEYYDDEQDAYAAEIKYIAQYNSTNSQYGYNVTEGGDGASAKLLFKKVRQYDLCGNLICEWPSIVDAAESSGIADCSISQNCYPDKYPEVKTAGGYQWELVDSPRDIPNLGKHYGEPLGFKQFDLEGNFIQEFISKKALVAAGFKYPSVLRACHKQRLSYKGYQWRFLYDTSPVLNIVRQKRITRSKNHINIINPGRKILQYDLQGKYIATWDSIKDVATYYNVHSSSISHVCRGKRQQACGYQWRYENKPIPVCAISHIRPGNKRAKKG